jgi:hypothetical protein
MTQQYLRLYLIPEMQTVVIKEALCGAEGEEARLRRGRVG